MADWNTPVLETQYELFLDYIKQRDVDAATNFFSDPTNPPNRAMRFNRSTLKWEEIVTGVWTAVVLSIAGGGTGGATAATARTALGIGTLGVQNSSAVAITGGVVSGLTTFELASNMTVLTDGAFNIGTNLKRIGITYIRNGLVVPVGIDKFVTV